MTQRRHGYSTAWEAARSIVRRRCSAGLYVGIPLAVVEAGFATFLRLVSNDSARTWLVRKLIFPELEEVGYGMKHVARHFLGLRKEVSLMLPGGGTLESADTVVVAALLGCGVLYCASTVRNRVIVQVCTQDIPNSALV